MYRIGQEEIDAVARVIKSKCLFKINDGLQEVKNFEAELKEKFGVSEALFMTSGKAALISALTAMGIGPGDEVIVPAYTYIATAIAVTAVGAIPVIAEIDETLTIDPKDVEKKISPYTKAIMPVHMQGFPCNMDAIVSLAQKYNLKVLEDACQADGGSYKGKRLGTIGDAGALSFNHFKIISAGEGGALLTDSRQIYERALIFHDSSAIAYFGGQLDEISEPQFCGMEFRANEISAAIMREQLKRLDGILFDLRSVKKRFMDALCDKYEFIPSNDIEGDCGTTLAFSFDSEQKARSFASKVKGDGYDVLLPIDTGKHVYSRWTPILNKKGAFNPLMDPFKMEANKHLNMNYSEDMCPNTLNYLAKTVYLMLNPDWTEEKIDGFIKICREA